MKKKSDGDGQFPKKNKGTNGLGGGTAYSIFRMPLTTREAVPQHEETKGEFNQIIDGKECHIISAGRISFIDFLPDKNKDLSPFRRRG